MQKTEKRQSEKLIRLLRFLLSAAVLFLFLSCLGDLAAWLIRVAGGFSFSVHHASTIGIIGGADGPTAIFVTAFVGPVWKTALKILLFLLSIPVWRYLNGNLKKGEE